MIMTKEEFMKLDDEAKYEAYLSANRKAKDPFSLVKLINRVCKILGRELTANERLNAAGAYKWCQNEKFVWRNNNPMELNDVACWLARKIM